MYDRVSFDSIPVLCVYNSCLDCDFHIRSGTRTQAFQPQSVCMWVRIETVVILPPTAEDNRTHKVSYRVAEVIVDSLRIRCFCSDSLRIWLFAQ